MGIHEIPLSQDRDEFIHEVYGRIPADFDNKHERSVESRYDDDAYPSEDTVYYQTRPMSLTPRQLNTTPAGKVNKMNQIQKTSTRTTRVNVEINADSWDELDERHKALVLLVLIGRENDNEQGMKDILYMLRDLVAEADIELIEIALAGLTTALVSPKKYALRIAIFEVLEDMIFQAEEDLAYLVSANSSEHFKYIAQTYQATINALKMYMKILSFTDGEMDRFHEGDASALSVKIGKLIRRMNRYLTENFDYDIKRS